MENISSPKLLMLRSPALHGLISFEVLKVNKQPTENDVDRLRREMETRMKEYERRTAVLEGQIRKIIQNINGRPGPRIE
jgi:hypothetical protein